MSGFQKFKSLLFSDEEENAGGEEEKKRQKRGGKGMLKSKKKEDVPKLVQVSRAPRGKKKSVTVVSGLSTFGKKYLVQFTYFHLNLRYVLPDFNRTKSITGCNSNNSLL